MLCHVMCLTTTSNLHVGLKLHFLFTCIAHECNGVKASNLQHNCTIIVCMSVHEQFDHCTPSSYGDRFKIEGG